jgi:hypothetical protein
MSRASAVDHHVRVGTPDFPSRRQPTGDVPEVPRRRSSVMPSDERLASLTSRGASPVRDTPARPVVTNRMPNRSPSPQGHARSESPVSPESPVSSLSSLLPIDAPMPRRLGANPFMGSGAPESPRPGTNPFRRNLSSSPDAASISHSHGRANSLDSGGRHLGGIRHRPSDADSVGSGSEAHELLLGGDRLRDSPPTRTSTPASSLRSGTPAEAPGGHLPMHTPPVRPEQFNSSPEAAGDHAVGGPEHRRGWLDRFQNAFQRAEPFAGQLLSIGASIANIGLSVLNTILNIKVTAAKNAEELSKR